MLYLLLRLLEYATATLLVSMNTFLAYYSMYFTNQSSCIYTLTIFLDTHFSSILYGKLSFFFYHIVHFC